MDNVPGSFLEIMLVKVTIDCGSILHFSPSGVFTKYVSFFVFFRDQCGEKSEVKDLLILIA